MIVFYSWQSDSPRKTNKKLIQDALEIAIAELNDEIEVEPSERPEAGIELDHDTKGVLGSPEVIKTILTKIKAADVVVSDVTLVAEGQENKRHINSNVAIELGYLMGVSDHEPMLKVMNTHYGGPDDLPFDLRDRRHPITYSAVPGATKPELVAVTKSLAKQFIGILREYLQRPPTISTIAKEPHTPEKSSYVDSAFWDIDKSIGPAYHIGYPFRSTELTRLPIIHTRIDVTIRRSSPDTVIVMPYSGLLRGCMVPVR